MTKPGRDPIKSWTSTPSTGWSVPKEHSGVRDANWITRSIDENIEIFTNLENIEELNYWEGVKSELKKL